MRWTLLLAASLVTLAPMAPGREPTPQRAQTPLACSNEHRLCWKYPRFRWWQYVQSAAATGTSFALEFGVEFPEHPTQNDGILFDNSVRNMLAASSGETRQQVADVSDVIWPTTQYFPLVEGLIIPLAADRLNYDVALQLTMIHWQVTGIAFLLTRLPHKFVPRGRPSLSDCEANPAYDGACNPEATGRSASFFSGHTSMSFASAATTCMNHAYLPLYGNEVADTLVCGASMASATTVGVMRIIADKHWATDVLTGAAVGLGVGLTVPYFLHYQYDVMEEGLGISSAVIPIASDSSAGLGLVGAF